MFSPDSQHVAFWAGTGEDSFAVIDGVEGKRYTGVGAPHFGPDSKRVAYEAQRGDHRLVVVDGVEGREYDDVLDPLAFSPDSRHLVYVAGRGEGTFLVVDGARAASPMSFSTAAASCSPVLALSSR